MKKSSLKQKAYKQIKEYYLIALYLWVVFSLFVLYKSAILAEEHIGFALHGFAVINALALAKVVLVARDLHFGERFDDAPLIYPTIFKSALFTILLACFKIVEDAAVGYFHRRSFQESISDLGGGTWQGILTLSLLLFAVLVPFFGIGELQRVLGVGKLTQLFFRQRPSLTATGSES